MSATMIDASPLRVDDFGRRFARGWVLRHCSFELRRGAVTALVGPNAAGKTTLMSAIAGLLAPTEGRIEVAGVAVSASPAHPELGYLAQDKPLYRRLRVREMLEVARHLNARWDCGHARNLVAAARLDPDARVGQLSGGQRTRLALALVLARRPSLLLLDEPLADLDPLARLEVQQTLMTEVIDTGMTVLMSSHILGEIQDLCEDLVLMDRGGIVLHGGLDDVLERHRILVGPGGGAEQSAFLPEDAIVEVSRAARQTTVLVNRPIPWLPPEWTEEAPTLDAVVIAYLRAGAAGGAPNHRDGAGR